MASITELGYMGLGVSNLEQWKDFAANVLALEVVASDSPDRCYLRLDHWHHRLILDEDGTDDLNYLGFRVAGAEEFRAMQRQLDKASVKFRIGSLAEAEERHVLEVMKLEDPSGNPVEIFHGPHIEPHKPFSSRQSILIILPAYNERENLTLLVRAIGTFLVADVLIVDDNSPDGTGEIADQLSHELPHVQVLHRKIKEGIGPAYISGFHWAIKKEYDLVVSMDCDFSHAPWDLPRLAYASETADLVIGSRYVPGGNIVNWNLFRRCLSRIGNRYVQQLLGTRIQDWQVSVLPNEFVE